MGLMIHSLEMLSQNARRDYYIYILDYGWQEPLSQTLRNNFQNMAERASKNESAVIIGVGDVGHFDTEVLSWHNINGDNADELLPAILITRTNPHDFKNMETIRNPDKDFSFILIPIKKVCKTETEVVALIKSIFKDIESKKDLKGFKVSKELKPGIGGAIVKSIILEPNFSGIGFSFNKLKDSLK
ncbi:hypothetical protein HZA73_05010 [candidate division TA06 bacterium]|nr:hypothetical protein [candidate division TA06 bacterium]